MPTIDALSDRLSGYLDLEQIRAVRRAYFYAEQAHDGQRRKSGEPYVTHPLSVASILAGMHMDHQSLMAAMLHDVIEDTEVNRDGLAGQFGDQVTDIVDGVSKLTHLEFETRAEAQAENFQKMVMAMAVDIRVILVKLADRLHNMRTLGAMPPEKQRRIARETLDIYAPVAARLGMRDMQLELEDLAFQAYHPMRSKYIRRAVVQARGQRKDIISSIEESIRSRLSQEGFGGVVSGREKHLYSIYSKMKSKGKSFEEIMDVFAFRIVTESVDDCYRVLGLFTACTSRLPGDSKITSPFLKPTAISPCTQIYSAPVISPLKYRSAPKKWMRLPVRVLRSTAITRFTGIPAVRWTVITVPVSGCRACWKCRSVPAIPWSSLKR